MTERKNIAHRRGKQRGDNAVSRWFETLRLEWEAYRAELRTGIKQIEAAAVDDFNTTLMSAGLTPEQRQEARDAAITLVQLGVTAEELPEAVRAVFRFRDSGITSEDMLDLTRIVNRAKRR